MVAKLIITQTLTQAIQVIVEAKITGVHSIFSWFLYQIKMAFYTTYTLLMSTNLLPIKLLIQSKCSSKVIPITNYKRLINIDKVLI